MPGQWRKKYVASAHDARELSECFEILLEYRERVERLLSFSDGLLEARGFYLYAHNKAEELNEIIRQNLSVIDDLLVAFISPEAKQFSIDRLANEYGYPDVDLRSMQIGPSV